MSGIRRFGTVYSENGTLISEYKSDADEKSDYDYDYKSDGQEIDYEYKEYLDNEPLEQYLPITNELILESIRKRQRQQRRGLVASISPVRRRNFGGYRPVSPNISPDVSPTR